MKILLTLFVLFFSSSVLGETYTCKLSYEDSSEKKFYDIVIVVNEDNNAGPIVLLDKQNKFRQMLVPGIYSTGKVYSNNYPLGGKISVDAYFTMISPWSIQGFFVNALNFIPIYIDIKQIDPSKISIWSYDPTHNMFSSTNSVGECK